MGCLGNATAYSSQFYFMRKIDLTGQTFFDFYVIKESDKRRNNNILWSCRCICGNIRDCLGRDLKIGKHKSCGCKRKDNLKKAVVTHGLTSTPEYNVWQTMKQRCNNKQSADYKYYGGRGIKICDRWDKFIFFLQDMGKRPSPEYSLERIDNNKMYCPENCKWDTKFNQSRNRRDNVWVEYNGEKIIVSDLAKLLKVYPQNIMTAIKNGRTIDEIVSHYKLKNKIGARTLKW